MDTVSAFSKGTVEVVRVTAPATALVVATAAVTAGIVYVSVVPPLGPPPPVAVNGPSNLESPVLTVSESPAETPLFGFVVSVAVVVPEIAFFVTE
jgi:hypothetical protein